MPNQYYGVSTDGKPLDVPVNSIYFEIDTCKFYYFDGLSWNEMPTCCKSGEEEMSTFIVDAIPTNPDDGEDFVFNASWNDIHRAFLEGKSVIIHSYWETISDYFDYIFPVVCCETPSTGYDYGITYICPRSYNTVSVGTDDPDENLQIQYIIVV